MKKLGAGLVAAGIAAAALAGGAQAQEYNWRMATLAPSETSTYFQLFAVPLVENIERLTAGRVEITAYPAGVLAPAFEVYDAVLDGRADVANIWPGYIVNLDPANSLLSAHPGGMGTDSFLTWLYDAGGEELWQEFRREEMGLASMVAGAGPTEIHMHSNRPVREISDLEGLRVRMSGAAAQVLSSFGGSPVTLPGGEIYTTLERGAVDAAEWATPAENIILGLHEIAPYIIVPGIHQPAFTFEFIMLADAWDALPEDIQFQIQAAAKLTTYESLSAWTMADIEALKQLRAMDGVEFITVSDDYLQAWREGGQQWAEERAQDNEWVRRISESYYSFLEDWENNVQMHLNQKH